MLKFLRVKTDTKSIISEDVKEEYAMFGGRGLIAKILNDEVNPKCDVLGPENKFIVCGGLLNGTTLPCSGRLSVGSKSPLTGGIKEANSGGIAGQLLAKLDIKAIIIENKPLNNEWFILKIDKNKAELLPADKYVGLNTYDLSAQLRSDFGEKIGMILIGTAGERSYRMASVQVTDMEGRPCRSAARGGLGAVMGSKGIKAIVLDAAGCTAKVEYADKDKFLANTRDLVKAVKQDPVGGLFHAIGTPGLVNMINGLGAMPTRNFSDGRWNKAEGISGEKIAEIQKSRGGINGHRCMSGCVISCSNIINDEKGNYLTGSFEYETIALLGPNLEIDNPDTIARIDRLCDDLGVDTIETGGMLGVCMEAGKIQFGDGEGALKIMQEMIDGTEFGKIIGNGAASAGKYLGVKRIPVAKNQTMAGYDPRGLKGIGVTYATSPMGADHTAGNPLGNPTLDPYKKDGQVPVSTYLQAFMATCDSLGMCMHMFMPCQDPTNLASFLELMSGRFDGKWDDDKLYAIGKQTVGLELAFNKGAGFTAKDDRLPDFMYEEALPSTGCKFDITQEEMAEALKGIA